MKQIFLTFLVIFSQLSYSSSVGAKIVGLSRDGSLVEFNAFIHSNGELKSLAEVEYLKSPSPKLANELFSRFNSAQTSYFKSQRNAAILAYKNVLEMQNAADWKPPQRKMLFNAALRVAELSDSAAEKVQYISSALQISVKLLPDSSVFPPPFIDSFRKTKPDLLIAEKVEAKGLIGFEKVSVSGQVVAAKDLSQINFPPGKTLVTAYSSRWKTAQQVLDFNEFKNWKPERKPLFQGNCSDISEKSATHPMISYIYFNSECIQPLNHSANIIVSDHRENSVPVVRSLKSASKNAVAGEIVNADSDPMPDSHPEPFLSDATTTKERIDNSQLDFTQLSAPIEESNVWWKNKWLWMGLAGASTAYIIYENNRRSNSSKSSPTVTYE